MMATDLFQKFGVNAGRRPKDLFETRGVTPPVSVGPVEGFFVDMGRGFMDAAQGAKQLGLLAGERLGLVDEGATDEYTRQLADEIALYERHRGRMSPGRFTGNLLAAAPIPGGVAGGAALRMGTSALAGAGIGAMMPVTEGDVLEGKGENLLTGAAGGAAGSALLSGAGKAYNALRGRYNSQAVQDVTDTARSVRNALSQPGSRAPDMPLSVGDVRGGAIIPKTETHLENIPVVGFAGIRERQNAVAKDWATRLIDRIDSGAVDVGEEIQKSAQTKFDFLRGVARKAFTEISDEADSYGPVPLTHFQQVAQKHADQLNRLIDANPQFKTLFGSRAQRMGSFAQNTELKYSDLRLLRDDLSDMAEGYMPGGEVIGKKGAGAFMELRQSMERDITDFMKQVGGELESKYLKAKRFYERRVVPYKGSSKTGLNLLLKDQEPDKLLKKWVYGDRADKAKRLWMAMTHDGREAVKIGILRDAFDTATSKQGAQFKVFSHAAFANTLDKFRKAIPQFFSREEEQLIQGYQKILRHTARAGQYMENPSTGARNALPMLIGGGVVAGGVASPMVTAQLAGGALGLRWLFGSKAGRQILLSASKIDADSKAMQSIANQIYRQVPKIGGVGAGQDLEGRSPNLLTGP